MAGLIAGLTLSQGNTDDPDKSRSGRDRQLTLDFANPLGNGEPVSPDQAAESIQACPECIGLPTDGPASVGAIKEAWTRAGDQAIAVDFEDGLRLYVYPDERSGEDWAKEVVASDGEDLSGALGMKLIELRDTSGVGIEMSASGPAALSWIEDGLMIEILGKGGQSLSALIEIGKSFPGASETAA